MKRLKEIWKQQRILLQIKREIRKETLTITRKAGIKKNSKQYFLVQQDVINGKPFFMGDSYKVPAGEKRMNSPVSRLHEKIMKYE